MGQTFQGMGSSDPGDMNTPTKLLQGGTKGLLNGFSNMQAQNQALRQPTGGGMQVPGGQAPAVDPSMFAPQQQNQPFKPLPIKGNNLAFYGQGGQ